MTVRGAEDADLAAILAISRTTPWEKSEYLRGQVALGNVGVACANGRVVGFIASNREFFSRWFVWLIVVEPAFRRGGVAGLLFDRVESRCAGERLYTSTNRSNVTMQRFLERRGFRVAGEVDLDPGDAEVFYCKDVGGPSTS